MATNVLRDCTFTLTPAGADIGSYTLGAPVTFKADTVAVSVNETLEDHSTAQDNTPLMRGTKKPFTITIETKMSLQASTGIENVIRNNDLVGFAATQAGSTTTDVSCECTRIETVEFNYGGPNTLRLVLQPYGVPLAQSF